MLKIYAIPVSLYCAKLRILLRYKNLHWQEIAPPGGYGSNEYKLTIPSGNLPTLIDGKLVLADSEAIAEYLNEKHPTPPMLPDDFAARAKIRELSRFHDTRLEPELRVLFPYIAADNRNPDVAAIQSEKLSSRLEQLAAILDQYTCNELTLADCGYPISFAWIDALTSVLDLQIDWPAAVISYRKRIENHPAIAAELADYIPKLQARLSS
ncbi:MAG: glutathione S-transferase family protein [Rhizobiaceae bacterium]